MKMLHWLLQTDSSLTGLILRVTLAVVMFPHGAQKVFGWFGGHGFKGTMKSFTGVGDSYGVCVAGDCCRVTRFSCPCRRALDACGRLRHRMRDARCYCHRSPAERLFHELGGKPERRGIRIPLACAGDGDQLDYCWGWRLVTGRRFGQLRLID